jgi:hypothetical protein
MAMEIVHQLSCAIHVRRGIHHHLQVSQGVILIAGGRPRSSFTWSLRGAEGNEPDHQGRGFQPVWMASVLRALLRIPSRSGWDRTCVLSVRIWIVVSYPLPPPCSVVWLVQCGIGMASN